VTNGPGCEDLRRAWALQNSLDTSLTDEEFDAGKCDAAIKACCAIAEQIEQCHATTIDGLRVKAAAILWCHSGEMKIELSPEQTTDVRLAQSMLRDLLPSGNRHERQDRQPV